MKQKEYIEKHIATHTVHSAEDRSAVSYLESVLNPEGRICTSFSCDDKWPNHDGFFEYVSDFEKRPFDKKEALLDEGEAKEKNS